MDFFSKFTKPADHSTPASDGQEPNSTTDSSNTDLFSSAKVVSGAAQSYFSHQPATYENAEVAGATANILDAASEYGKLDKTQGVGKYVDQAESYLKDYESSNTTAAAAASTDTVADTSVKSAPTIEATETDTAAIKGADASTEESSKPELYGEEDATEGLSSKLPTVDTPVETDTSGVYGEDKADSYGEEDATEGLSSKLPAVDAPVETETSGVYGEDKADSYGEEDATEGLSSKLPAVDAPVETDTSGVYGEDKADFLPNKASGGGVASETDAGDDYTHASGDGATTKTDISDDYQKPKADEYEETTEEDITKKPAAAVTDSSDQDYAKDTEEGISVKPSSGGQAAEADSGDSGYTENTEEGIPKLSAGGYAAGDDAREKVNPEGGFGNFTKVAGDFLNK